MNEEQINKIYELLDSIKVNKKNEKVIEEIRQELLNKDYVKVLKKIEELNNLIDEDEQEKKKIDTGEQEDDGIYPK